MNCSQYNSLGNYFNIMMPSTKEELNKTITERYTKGNPSTVDEKPEFKNRFFSDEYKNNYVYGVSSETAGKK